MTYDMTTNTNPPANTLPIGAGDREAGSSPGSASRTLRERVAAEIRKHILIDETGLAPSGMYGFQDAADAAIAEVMAWQPIETAPKDRRIMLYRPSTFELAKVVAGKWEPDEWASKPRPYWSHDLGLLTGKQEERKCAPTHWIPLPSTPNRGEK